MDLDRSFNLSHLRSAVVLLLSLLVCFGAARLGALATMPAIPTWYAALEKPAFAPPNWVFPVVWTLLYFLMALALWRVAVPAERDATAWGALLAFGVQLVLNVLWSFAFFAGQNPAAGFGTILFLLAAIVWTMVRFVRVERAAAILLVPYLLWVSYAALLNAAIWRLN